MRVLRWLLIALGALAVGVALLLLVARFLDGPIGPIPGGPLRGEVSAEDPGDWSFAGDVPTLELQVGGRSLTTWYVTRGGILYVAAAEAESKRWPREVVADGRVRLRVGGRLYERNAVRITDRAVLEPVGDVFRAKYRVELSPEAAERVWVFRLDPRE
jgi:hypothetical protein